MHLLSPGLVMYHALSHHPRRHQDLSFREQRQRSVCTDTTLANICSEVHRVSDYYSKYLHIWYFEVHGTRREIQQAGLQRSLSPRHRLREKSERATLDERNPHALGAYYKD